jgi:putative MATE family efflux protein
MMGGSLFEIAMLIADGVMCGHIADQGRSLTALGFAAQIVMLLHVVGSALEVGTVALMSRAHGAGDSERMNRIVSQSAQLAIVLGAAVGAIGLAFGHRIIGWLGASPDVADAGARYLEVLMLAFPASFLGQSLSGVLRSLENTRLPFLCAVAGNVLNAALGYALILGHWGLPEMGIRGAGIAAAISEASVVTLLMVGIHAQSVGGLVIRLRVTAVDRGIVSQIARVGLPSLLEQATFYGSMTALIWILARIDEPSVAAHSIGSRMAAFLMIPAFALSGASSALVGNALGGGSADDARKVFRISSVLALAIMLPIGVATYFITPWIAAAYDVVPGSPLAGYTFNCLHLVSLSIVLQGLMLMFEGLLLGAGASSTVMKINLSVDLGLRITLAACLGLATNLGAVGVWLSWPAALLVQLPLALIAYRRGRWAVVGIGVGD